MKLSALRLFVRDIAAAREFWRGQVGLGLSTDGSAQGFCTFDAGNGLTLIVEAVPADAPADEQGLVGRFTGASFAVDDIAAEHARLVAAGVTFTGAPEQQFWGGWLATFADPAGNQIQLAQYPKV